MRPDQLRHTVGATLSQVRERLVEVPWRGAASVDVEDTSVAKREVESEIASEALRTTASRR